VKFEIPLKSGRLIRRYKRFLADVEADSGEILTVHCPNSGSMMGLLDRGNPVYFWESPNVKRRYRHTWELVAVNGILVGINTNRPNRLVEEGVRAGVVKELEGYRFVRREVVWGAHSRLDLLFERNGRLCYVEVKNVTLAENGVAFFPDAVTSRGAKHLLDLQEIVRKGHRGAVFFVVQRSDASVFRPAWHIDPHFSATLVEVANSGIDVIAYQADVRLDGIWLRNSLPVELDRQ
jgi:sugar fermentation stimulation protein A